MPSQHLNIYCVETNAKTFMKMLEAYELRRGFSRNRGPKLSNTKTISPGLTTGSGTVSGYKFPYGRLDGSSCGTQRRLVSAHQLSATETSPMPICKSMRLHACESNSESAWRVDYAAQASRSSREGIFVDTSFR